MMSRRTLLRAVVFASLAASCGPGARPGGGTSGPSETTPGGSGIMPSPSATEVRLQLARVPVATDPSAGAAMFGAFAGSLLGEAMKRETGNLILSPWSITMALAMIRAGAASRTAEQLDAAMHVPSAPDGFLDSTVNTAAQLLDARTERVVTEERTGDVALRSATATWAAPGIAWKRPFLETLAKFYGSGVRLTDFARDPEAARRAINAWVAEHTEGKIPELVPTGAIDKGTLIAVVNAVYFKAPWLDAFERDLNVVKDFTLADGTVKRAQMMRGLLANAAQSGSGWVAGTVPYLGGRLAFTTVLPDRGREAEVRAWLSGTGITELLAGRGQGLLALTIPKFRFRSSLPLKQVLIALGVRDAFDAGAADFSGLTDDQRVYVSEAVHQATIGIDEEGTEATAATAAFGRGGGAPEPVTIVLDRPFYLVIHDLETRVPLFVGHVADPTDVS